MQESKGSLPVAPSGWAPASPTPSPMSATHAWAWGEPICQTTHSLTSWFCHVIQNFQGQEPWSPHLRKGTHATFPGGSARHPLWSEEEQAVCGGGSGWHRVGAPSDHCHLLQHHCRHHHVLRPSRCLCSGPGVDRTPSVIFLGIGSANN